MIVDNPQKKAAGKYDSKKNDEMAGVKKFVLHRCDIFLIVANKYFKWYNYL